MKLKNSSKKEHLSRLERFSAQFNSNKIFLVGEHGIDIEKFLLTPIET